jgi:hypothetical protein
VFILRDALGEAIDTWDPEIFEELQGAFTIQEDGVPIDTDETNIFVTHAENLRYNVVILLDFTASMYHAGDGGGAVIDSMVDAAIEFIEDLPDTYRIAIMEYHDRQQTNRMIQDFTTSKATLIDALQNFSVPVGAHGASEIRDALVDAALLLAFDDLLTLPFDDADVRAVVFVSDGRDTSSINTLDETLEFIEDTRVRLYPIGFGSDVNAPALIRLATDSGGHYYPAPNETALVEALGNESALGPDAPGIVAKDLSRQIVLSYPTLFQEGEHTYLITALFRGLQGSFQRDGVFAVGGDVRAGQIALRTAGIQPDGTADVFIRADYIPREVTEIRVRIISPEPGYTVEIVPDGLLDGWTLEDETSGNEFFTVSTTPDNPLQYGDFGPLLRVSYTGLTPGSDFEMGFRVDNRIYINPPFTKFFQYPDAIIVGDGTSQESVIPILITDGFDPDAPGAFDRDGDGVDDFDDLFPDDDTMS